MERPFLERVAPARAAPSDCVLFCSNFASASECVTFTKVSVRGASRDRLLRRGIQTRCRGGLPHFALGALVTQILSPIHLALRAAEAGEAWSLRPACPQLIHVMCARTCMIQEDCPAG